MIIIGHVDGIQHVAGNLMNFFSWLGFHIPEVAIASWVGENDEDTTKDWDQIEKNRYTQEDLSNLVASALRLACALKRHVRDRGCRTVRTLCAFPVPSRPVPGCRLAARGYCIP